jgi:photosystem II stability/assembly factor-like uncharacterized protein
MRLRGALGAATGWRSVLIASLLLTPTVAKKDEPKITSTKFEAAPQNLQYFEDSNVVLFQDYEKNVVYRSDDAGESWKIISNVPEGKAWDLWMHPYAKDRAYILTKEKTHWATKDRGQSWEEFFTDAEPSMFRKPLAFHAGDPDKIIFHGQDCGGIFCEELVCLIWDEWEGDAG